MKTVRLSYAQTLELNACPETVAAIGFFDGIHKGHQKLIHTAVHTAKEKGMKSAVITFYPHPKVILKKDTQAVRYLTPVEEKEAILAELDVDYLYIIDFTKELSQLSPQGFIDHFIKGLNIQHLVAGFDFSYGHMGKGSMETMEEHAAGAFTYNVIEKVEQDGDKISSTRIRHLLAEGKVEEANDLLGRPLIARGVVVDGERRGRQLGFPTANINVSDEYLLPKTGVYAVTVLHNGKRVKGMASLGYNPTFDTVHEKPRIEVHIFDFNQEIYGQELGIEWRFFLREEEKYDHIDDLIAQIHNDEEVSRKLLSST
ncbi:bifunctional riboflavin kinase/FAD synthetase [Radiobacillus kanasensis]|uniref:bifunctional riboflavin kinase/FAD synthetase n=1 Tax=Radiobacillus kanasensis TaxID=2844358 RepID=UPI001E65551D|nr:bifunctional riboflavin kinase/FAD synthetase [Radiobacillus kanasensis]UFU01071.1 bifunctional riboflavin kinase/FAD synthetase [Radiobacillus kanasensis]